MIYLNGNLYEYKLFPNQELQMPIYGTEIINRITLKFENSNDLIALMFLKKYLDNYNLYNSYTVLELFYIPYERMDRETKHQMFTAKYFGEFINSLNFDRVEVLDPHSNVVMGVLNKAHQINLKYIIFQQIPDWFDYIFFPDNGAKKKYIELLDPVPKPYFYGDKHRDLNTGKISDYNIFENPELKDKTVLIIDDLCVKGYTALNAAKKLKEMGANRVYFYCSHCENAIFDGEILTTDYIDKVYTTNSLELRQKNEKINIIKLF